MSKIFKLMKFMKSYFKIKVFKALKNYFYNFVIFIFFPIILFPAFAFSLEKQMNAFGTYLYVDFFEDKKAEPATEVLFKDIPAKKEDIIELSFNSPTNSIKQILAVMANSKADFIPSKQDFISPVSQKTKKFHMVTDIPYDFEVLANRCKAITLPVNADRFLFSLNDSFFSNNGEISINLKVDKVLFQIRDKTIYQVVPSPKNDLKDLSDTFDLVENKPVVLKLVYEKLADSSSTKVFKPIIKIDGKKYKAQCFDKDKKIKISCDFNMSHFDSRGLFEQTVVLSMDEKSVLAKEGFYKVELGFQHKACKSEYTSYSFNLNVHKTRKLQIGFIGVDGTKDKDWKDFIQDSLNDFSFLKRTFPVPDAGDNIPQWIMLDDKLVTENTQSLNQEVASDSSLTKGKIIRSQEMVFDRSTNYLKDIKALKKMRIKQQLGKLFAIADKDYFSKIYRPGVAGFVVFTNRGSYTENVGFVRVDQGGTGTILHELAHTLGQLNEFYQKSSQQLSANSTCYLQGRSDYCFRFKDFKGLSSSFKEDIDKWSFITKENSIMDYSSSLNKQWIDRDTYGKVLKTLSDPELDPEILIFSGIFNSKEFIDPELEYVPEGYLTNTNPEGNLNIKILDKNNKELYNLKISTKVSIEFIDSDFNKISETQELALAPVAVALPYLDEAQKVIIIDEETGKQVYFQDLDEENVVRISSKPDLSSRTVYE